MRKLAMLVIAAALMPLAGMAVYVDYSLTQYTWDYPLDENHGYYLMLIDGTYSYESLWAAVPDGENTTADLGNIQRDKILYSGSTHATTGGFEIGQTAASAAYLAVFTTDDFPSEAYYTLYSITKLKDSGTSFGPDDAIWNFNTYHVKTLSNSIPEPSSGLLTLAGLSVLALKRKRRACVFS